MRSEVEGRHAATGWTDRAQSRYQRHIEEHRGEHDEAVAGRSRSWPAATACGGSSWPARRARWGFPRSPGDRARRPGGRRQPGRGARADGAIAERAVEHLARVEEQEDAEAVDRLLDAAAKGGRAVAGLEPTLEAVNRNAVQQLYLLPSFERRGAICQGCSALQPPAPSDRCRFCGEAARPAELGEAMTGRVLASGGSVGMVDRHAGLGAQGGVGAVLRYAA